jgi:alpha-glucosidase
MVLNLGMSGIAVTGPDVGGFTGGPTPELFARWMQVGAFMPFFRVHSRQGSPDQEPWAFGPQVERISRKALELRYRLLPYIYTALWQASQTGAPIARALPFVYPADTNTYSLDDEYLFGDAFLVAPVYEPEATARRVYLPAGDWYDFWTNRRYGGGQTITVDAPVEVLPLFVRAGSVIPLGPEAQYVGEELVDDTLSLVAYLGEGCSQLYEDDGESMAYTQGQYRLSRFEVRPTATGWAISQHTSGSFRPPYAHYEWQVWGLEQESVGVQVDGADVQVRHAHGCLFFSTLPTFKTLEIAVP